MKQIRKRLTYANVMSSIAVFFVLGGGAAFAATQLPRNSVGPTQIRANAVQTNKIARNAVTVGKIGPEAVKAGKLAKNAIATDRLRDNVVSGAKIADLAVGTGKIGDEAVATGKLAPGAVDTSRLGDGAVRASKLGLIELRTNSVPIANGANGGVSVQCPVNSVVLSGGFQPNNFGVEATSSLRVANGWLYQAKNNSGGASVLRVFAYCLLG